MKHSEEVIRQLLGSVQFKSNSAKTQVENTGSAGGFLPKNRVGIRAGHGDAFGFALNGVSLGGLRNSFCRRSGDAGSGGRGRFAKSACGRLEAVRRFDGNRTSRRHGLRGFDRGRRGCFGRTRSRGHAVICMFLRIEPFIGNSNQLIGVFAVLGKSGDAVVHADADGELETPERIGEDNANAAAERNSLRGVSLRQNEGKFIAADPESGIGGAQSFL